MAEPSERVEHGPSSRPPLDPDTLRLSDFVTGEDGRQPGPDAAAAWLDSGERLRGMIARGDVQDPPQRRLGWRYIGDMALRLFRRGGDRER